MRLIDADLLKETIASNVYPVADAFNSRDYGMFWTGGIEKAIDEQPTIEPKKGKWIEDAETFYKAVNEKGGGVDADTPFFTEDYIACSECLSLFSVIDNETERFDFCPHCGVRLEEGASS